MISAPHVRLTIIFLPTFYLCRICKSKPANPSYQHASMKKFYHSVAGPLLMGAGFIGMIAMTACSKKDKSGSPTTTSTDTSVLSDAVKEDSLKYLMYRNMMTDFITDVNDKTDLPGYYWYKSVPTLDPHGSIYVNADSLLSVMKQYAINPNTSAPYDHYSFLDRDSSISTQLQDGKVATVKAVTGDFGMEVSFAEDGSGNLHLLVLYSDKNSPAYKAGITRGTELMSVNGISSYTGTSAQIATLSTALYGSSSVSLTIRQYGASTTSSLTLTTGAYNINPILYDTIYNTAQGNVGYFSFYTFTNTYNSAGTASLTKQVLDAEITKLKAANVTNLIVDLRYNGGGSVATAEYLDSALAPSSAAGKVMYYTMYNDKLSAWAGVSTNGDPTNFPSTTGGLSLQNVFFIVSRSTASASELTMNNLKPYMNVKLVGDTTYGKPVGFIGTTLQAHKNGAAVYLADLYAINFETKNSSQQGGYFTGILPDKEEYDYIDVPWGNSSDANLSDIFSYISNGSFSSNGRVAAQANVNNRAAVRTRLNLSTLRFNGMIEFKTKRKN